MQSLVEQIRDLERKHAERGGDQAAVIKPAELLATGWDAVDAALGGGLVRGALHEWFGLASTAEIPSRRPSQVSWRPPLGILVHLSWRVMDTDDAGRWIAWIGRCCFPYPAAMIRGTAADRSLLERSLFVSPRTPSDRLWAADLCLRSPAIGAVIGDGSGFDMAATRRVQLVARKQGIPALVVRPPWEQDVMSAAQSRWRVRENAVAGDGPQDAMNPLWTLELLRCKGVHFGQTQSAWNLEWDRATSTLGLSTAVADQTGASQTEQTNRLRARRLA